MKSIAPMLLALNTLTVAAFAQTSHAGHAAGPTAAIAFENASLRVVRITLKPHEKVPMHEVTPRLVIWVTGGHLRMTFPDGRSIEENRKPGDTQWLNAQRHAGENLADTPLELLAIIPKSSEAH